jgi:hypothetical protein
MACTEVGKSRERRKFRIKLGDKQYEWNYRNSHIDHLHFSRKEKTYMRSQRALMVSVK